MFKVPVILSWKHEPVEHRVFFKIHCAKKACVGKECSHIEPTRETEGVLQLSHHAVGQERNSIYSGAAKHYFQKESTLPKRYKLVATIEDPSLQTVYSWEEESLRSL